MISFGPFRLEPDSGRLLRDGVALQIGHRAMVLLQVLIGAAGRTISKAELMEQVWPDQIVEEGNLTVQIAALRKAMGTDSEGRDWILTVPRVGYKLIGGTTASPVAPPSSVLPSLAVLPFQNLGGDPEQDYFADGIVEDIITALSRFKSFAVIARNSSFVYKGRTVDVRQVASDLGVRYMLEGSVRRAGDRLRISAQLVDGETGTHLWAQNFDGTLDDIFDMQDRITASVAAIVEPQIQVAEIERSRRERPGSVAAYDLYLRALTKHNDATPEGHAAAYALLSEALRLEPENPILLGLAATTLNHRLNTGAPPLGSDDLQICIKLAHQGLGRAAGNALVMAQCGMALIITGREYELGFAAVQRAVQTNPNCLYVLLCAGVANLLCGSVDECLTYLHRSLKMSPGDPQQRYALTGIAHAHMVRRNFEEAINWAERSLAINTQYTPTYWMLIAAHAQLGHVAESRRYLDALQRVTPGVTVADIKAGQPDKDPARIAAILEGLRLAGMPENSPETPMLPSLAVLPFTNLSGDVSQDYFADGVVEDIITALSRFRSFTVIARNSSFIYKGRNVPLHQLVEELGVHYVLEGSVRRAGDTLRITAGLSNARDGNLFFSKTFDGDVSGIFAFQDQITETVATIVEPNIRAAELQRIRRERPKSIAAYDIYLQALAKILSETQADNAEACRLLTSALELEPNNGILLGQIVYALEHRITMGWPNVGPDDRAKIFDFAKRGLEHANGDPQTMVHCGMALVQACREYDWGMAVVEAAAMANPNHLIVTTAAGVATLHCGSIDAALSHFQRAYRLSPFDPFAHISLCGMAHCYMILGKFDDAIVWASRALALNTKFDPTHWMLIAANAQLGRLEEARRYLHDLLQLAPGVTVSSIKAGQPAKTPDRLANILEGLRLAGMPVN